MNRNIEEQFLKDVSKHQLRVLADDGVTRYLDLRNPENSNQYFHITTWPYHLCISGDMGTFVFNRLPDMFQFFRSSSGKLDINPGYWAEKLEAICRRSGYEEFSEERFRDEVKEYFDGYYYGGYRTAEDMEDAPLCWAEIEENVFDQIDNGGQEALRALHDFKYKDFDFCDFSYGAVTRYTYHYIWCLYAIVWAITQYDTKTTPRRS